MKPTTHKHPQFQLNRLIQYGALIIVVILIIMAPLQVMLTLAGAPGGLFICSAFVTLLLALPLLMLTAITPSISTSPEGITIDPAIWKSHQIAWDDIQAVKVFPLLPQADAEITRKIFVGRKKYNPAEGIMLVIPALPMQYRIAGFFAGAGSQPIIAITNRAHNDYDQLFTTILEQTDSAIHDDDLKDETE